VYGLIVGAMLTYGYVYFDAPGIVARLNRATEHAVQSTSGYR
jgi:hypothetical protein